MMTNRLTSEQLEAIRKRAEAATKGNPLKDANVLARMDRVILEDIPALLAEVERLQNIMRKLPDEIYGVTDGEVSYDIISEAVREAIRIDNE